MRRVLIAFASVIFIFFLLNFLFPFKPQITYSQIVLSSEGELLHAFLTPDDKWRMYTALEEITPTLKKAIIHKEDKHFYQHFGVNPFSVGRAVFKNLIKAKRTSGASTITMQVARMLEPKERTYVNKIVEVFRAFQLELNFSKDEILQMYLNLVPYGGNIEGVKSASLIYFQKMPDKLSLAETTALSIIPNRPNSLRIGQTNDLIVSERNRWLESFREDGIFDERDISDALDEPLHARRHLLDRIAPQLAYRLKASDILEPVIRSSIDINMQMKTEAMVKNYAEQLYHANINNAAAIVVDNETMQVKAYVGSADYYSSRDGGQVDGIRAVRSPGSTLKPLLYGLAIDEGLITPLSVIADVPVNFRGYQPQNYQENYNGNVTVSYALANSLNIPAVKVLHDLTPAKLINSLVEADFRQVASDRDVLGLSTALGGCGATLEELTTLYAAFAHDGKISSLNFHHRDTIGKMRKVLSEESNYMISEILTGLTRPDLPAHWKNSENLPKVAWKTGTSYGRRDAWSIGYNKKYTIGVWVGNFSGEGVPELTGTDMAAPLLFSIFNSVDRESAKEWFTMPAGVQFRFVCTETGLVPHEFCQSQKLDYFLPGVSAYHSCDHARYVMVSPDSSMSYCKSCQPNSGYVKALYPNLKPDLLAFYTAENINYPKIPPHNPDCERVFSGNAPKIISPIDQLEYLIDKNDSMQVMLSCHVANNVEKVYWYINEKFYQAAPAGETIYFSPPDGKVSIGCSDDKGRHSRISIDVKKIRF